MHYLAKNIMVVQEVKNMISRKGVNASHCNAGARLSRSVHIHIRDKDNHHEEVPIARFSVDPNEKCSYELILFLL